MQVKKLRLEKSKSPKLTHMIRIGQERPGPLPFATTGQQQKMGYHDANPSAAAAQWVLSTEQKAKTFPVTLSPFPLGRNRPESASLSQQRCPPEFGNPN